MVYGVKFTPDGRRVASCSQDRTIRLWNAKSGKSLWVYRGHVDAVSSLAVSRDGLRIVSCGGYGDRSVRLWDATVCDKVRGLFFGAAAFGTLWLLWWWCFSPPLVVLMAPGKGPPQSSQGDEEAGRSPFHDRTTTRGIVAGR